MARHSIGKLKFDLSKQGLGFGWGDGEVRSLFGRKASDEPEYDEREDAYADPGYDDGYADDYADEGYDDGYADDEGYEDDGYDDGYGDEAYDDDGYADDGYDDDYADDGYADDEGYDDEYADDGYGDDGYEDEGYDDRYADSDAGDDYYRDQSPLMAYVDENDWVTYVLLVLLPPLGIYLLWRRGCFEKPIRIGVSAASGIWFVVALILIVTGIFRGTNDLPQMATVTLSPTSTPTIAPLKTEAPEDPDGNADLSGIYESAGTQTGGTTDAEPTAQPAPTPLNDGTASAALNTSDYVYSPATGLYYHGRSDCTNIDSGVSVSRVPKDVAENNRKQSACPLCMNGGAGDASSYYATRGGTYYHVDEHCSGMTTAIPYTKDAAERAGKQPCPVCITKTQQSLSTSAVKFITKATIDKSNVPVYTTKNGTYFHLTSNCSGMTGASRGSMKDALLNGKKACPTCCASAGTVVYCTQGGKNYHSNKTCSGMTGAAEVSVAEAMVLGKTACPTCMKNGSVSATEMAQQSNTQSTNTTDDAYVYATPNGTYYHTNSTCSGMSGAQRYTLKSMLLQKRKACPKCASASDTTVYATQGGKYYHSYATCSGMTKATSGSMAEALAAGYKRCPNCWSAASNGTPALSGITATSATTASGTTTGSTPIAVSNPASKKATASNTYVYATKAGKYYHLNSTCSGMKDASRILLKQAVNNGKTACPTCASTANRTVYSTANGSYYHAAAVCAKTGMKNGQARTLQQALMMNQTICPYCMTSGKSTTTTTKTATTKKTATATKKPTTNASVAAIRKAAQNLKSSNTYKNGRSGIKVYARADGKYYHRRSNCSGMTHASHITLEMAMNYGKRACPVCASSARRTVYATRGTKYYHYNKTCAGVGAKTGSLASALGYGYKGCPYCVTKTKTLTKKSTYKSGASGVKVYTTASSKYYHAKRNCSGMTGASRVTLEAAMNYGKKACPTCMASATKTVYSSGSDKYYHYYKAHAGAGASSGSLAKAKALGKKLCPTCAKGGSAAKKTSSGISSYKKAAASVKKYSASASTKVYVKLTGSYFYYYHKSSKCSKMGMTNGTKITLEFAKDWGYKACPYCQPPTSIA